MNEVRDVEFETLRDDGECVVARRFGLDPGAAPTVDFDISPVRPDDRASIAPRPTLKVSNTSIDS